MRPGWEIVKLDEVISFERGLTYAKGDEVAFSSVGVLRSNNVDLTTQSLNLDEIKYLREDFEVPSKKKVRKSSLLMCMSNGSKDHLGKVALIDRELDYAFGGFMGLLTPDEGKVFPKYLYYALASKSFKDYIHSLADGANINNLKYKDLAAFDILLPSLAEQQRIVDILDREFAKIDALKANAEKSLQAAKDLFQATLKKELEPKEGWKRTMLKDIAVVRVGPFGSSLHKNDYISGGTPLVNPIHMKDGQVVPAVDFSVNQEKLNELRSYILKEGDVVFARRGEIGRCALITEKEDGFLCGTGSLFVRFTRRANPKFMLALFNSPYVKEQLLSKATGATMLNINSTSVENLEMYLPKETEQEEILSCIEDLNDKCSSLQDNYQKTLTLCDDLKQSLLRKAFSGEL